MTPRPHSEHGARKGEHRGRSSNPVIKVTISRGWNSRSRIWFARKRLRMRSASPPCRAAATSCSCVAAIRVRRVCSSAAGQRRDSSVPHSSPRTRLTSGGWLTPTARRRARCPRRSAGSPWIWQTPAVCRFALFAGTRQLETLPAQSAHTFNFGTELLRVNALQRPPRQPARVQRLGHVVLQTTRYLESLDWYLDQLGMIVSDFLFFPGQRDRGPTMSFIRCDRGQTPADHHTHRGRVGADEPLRPLGVSGVRPRCPGRRRGVLERRWLPTLLGNRPTRPRQSDIRLLARP